MSTEWDDPEKADDETPLGVYESGTKEESITREENGHEEHFSEKYHHRAYERRKAQEEALYKHKYSAAEAAEQLRQGVLSRDLKPHSKRLVEWATGEREEQTQLFIPHAEVKDKKTRAKITRYNQLLKQLRIQGDNLAPEKRNEFRKLHKELVREEDEPRSKTVSEAVIVPDKEGRTPHEAEQERISNTLKRDYETKPKLYPRSHIIQDEVLHGAHRGDEELMVDQQGAGDRETIEGTIGKYSQEELHKHRAKEVHTIDEEGHWQTEPTRFGWESTYRFNKEQFKRKIRGLQTGETSLGLKPFGAPPEKANLTIGRNQEHVIKTANWEQIPPREDEKAPAQDKFIVRLKHEPIAQTHMDASGKYTEEGQNIGETLRKAGLVDIEGNPTVQVAPGIEYDEHGIKKPLSERSKPVADNVYTLVTPEGKHLTPDEIAKLKVALHTNHGLVDFKEVQTAKWRNQRAIAPIGFHKLPKGIKEQDVMPGTYRRDMYKNRFGTKHGERDVITGELLPDQKDTLGMHVGPWAIQRHFDESTDAMGWGTSWRPGNKEVSSVALALPRARRNKKIFEATEATHPSNEEGRLFQYGDEAKLDQLVKEEHPELETQAEIDEQKSKYREHGKQLAAAGFASAYYSTKKGLPMKLAAKAYHGAEKIPKIGPKISQSGFESNLEEFFKDVDLAKQPLGAKMSRVKYRIVHPLGDPNDPTMAGVSWDEKRLHIPQWRYRKFPIHPANREGRKFERASYNLSGRIKARKEINEFLKSDSKNIYKKWQARSAAVDPAERMSNRLIDQIDAEISRVGAEKHKQNVILGIRKIDMAKDKNAQRYRAYLESAEKRLQSLRNEVIQPSGETKPEYLHEGLRNLWAHKYPHSGEVRIPKSFKVGGGIVLGAAAITGAGLLAADTYQTYEHNKGHTVRHPILKAVVPERIMRPTVSVHKTREYALPTNAVTDALDFQGEKVPTAWRASVGRKEVTRLREHKDISGESYKENLPLFGGIRGKPAPVKGSVKQAILPKASPSGLGTPKNMYVAKRKVPVDITIGKKERWDNKKHKLNARNNPYKLDQDDREHLLQLAKSSPEEESRINTFYYGDQKLTDMREDPDEVARVQKKNRYWLQGGKSHGYPTIDEIKAKAGVGVSQQSSMTLDEARKSRNRFETRRKEQKRERNAKQSNLRRS